jgi:hypothetical protein
MPAGDVFGLDGIFINISNPVVVSTIGVNSTSSFAGVAATGGSFVSGTVGGTVTLNLSDSAGLSTTPFYTGAKIAVAGFGDTTGVAHTGYNGTFTVTGFAGTTTISYAIENYVGTVSPSISTTGQVTLVTDSSVTNTTWSSSQTHGWFGGGFAPAALARVSTIDRVDFSNDSITAIARGSLSLAKDQAAATGNSNYGWFGGGGTPAVTLSTVDRIDFSNDFSTASVRGPLSLARYNLASTGNSNYGWFGGGTVGINQSSITDRINFSNDSSTASLRGSLTLVRRDLAATSNSDYGWYIAGGNSTQNEFSTVDRIDFSNDSTTASPRGPLSAARYAVAATGNSNYGWIGGGNSGAPITSKSFVNRIDFSNDSVVVNIRGPLSVGKAQTAATGNSNYGWFGGGAGIPALRYSTVDRIDFSNDSTTASVRGQLSQAKFTFAATSGQARSSSTRPQKSGSYGWFGGGLQFPSTPSLRSTVDRINFSNDLVAASPRGVLSQARWRLASTGNSNYGWWSGGILQTGPLQVSTTVDRIDFSNDSPTASVRGSLSATRYSLAATGNSNYGWFGGGSNPGGSTVTTVNRIDFSNDLATPSPRGSLLTVRSNLASTGNSNYGWWGGGYAFAIPTPSSFKPTVERIDFSNDSPTASPRGSLTLARYPVSATGNSNYGWFGGGRLDPTTVTSTVDRINFSNDLATASVRGSLSEARVNLASTGNSNYGWFGGGYVPSIPSAISNRSTVDRINFSNDLATAATRGPLSSTRYVMGATSNTTR